jgi:hypothetical protein
MDGRSDSSQKFHFVFYHRAVYDILWKNVLEPVRQQITIRPICSACCIPKDTNAYTGCVIRFAFLLQQWLQEHASLLGYTYIAHEK